MCMGVHIYTFPRTLIHLPRARARACACAWTSFLVLLITLFTVLFHALPNSPYSLSPKSIEREGALLSDEAYE